MTKIAKFNIIISSKLIGGVCNFFCTTNYFLILFYRIWCILIYRVFIWRRIKTIWYCTLLLVLHNYCVIISECQKVSLWGVSPQKCCQKMKKKKKLLEIAWNGEKIDRKYRVIISECQKVTFWGVKTTQIWSKNGKNKVAWNCLKWRENCSKIRCDHFWMLKSYFLVIWEYRNLVKKWKTYKTMGYFLVVCGVTY